MKTSRVLAVIALLAPLSACQLAESWNPPDLSGPELAWGAATGGSEVVMRIAEPRPRLQGEPDSTFRIMVRADDNVAVAELRLSVVGTFRCATRAGDWIAPYDVIRELPETRIDQPARVTYADAQLRVLGSSCGRFQVPGTDREEELFAVGGSYTLYALATDQAGRSAGSTMTILTDTAPSHAARRRHAAI